MLTSTLTAMRTVILLFTLQHFLVGGSVTGFGGNFVDIL